MTQPFTTRAEASAPPTHLIEVMCAAHHDRSISPGSKRALWSQITDEWRSAAHLDMRAAILAAEAAGYRIESGDSRDHAHAGGVKVEGAG